MLYNHSQLLFSEAVTQRCYVKKMFLEILQNSLENTCASLFFLIKLQVQTCNLGSEALAQVFSVNSAKFLGASFLTDHLQ